MEKIEFDNHDERIRYYELLLERDLEQIPQIELPEGYRFVFYKQGDRDTWIDIEKSAKEFVSYEQGLASWNKYYENRQEELPVRMVFIENSAGEKVATATAFYDIYGRDISMLKYLRRPTRGWHVKYIWILALCLWRKMQSIVVTGGGL